MNPSRKMNNVSRVKLCYTLRRAHLPSNTYFSQQLQPLYLLAWFMLEINFKVEFQTTLDRGKLLSSAGKNSSKKMVKHFLSSRGYLF